MTVLVRHDVGCKWGRFDGSVDEHANILSGEVRPGHSDAAKRFSDAFNLHKAAGARGWIAVRYRDGSSSGDVYDSREDAVRDSWPWDDDFFYATLAGGPSMTVCAAESLLRYRRVMSEMDRAHTDRDAPHGGLEVIQRLTAEDNEAQIAAVRARRGVIPMGYRKGLT